MVLNNREDNKYSVLKTIVNIVGVIVLVLIILHFSTDFDLFKFSYKGGSVTIVNGDSGKENLDTVKVNLDSAMSNSGLNTDSLPVEYEQVSFDPSDVVYSDYEIIYYIKSNNTRLREEPTTSSEIKTELYANQQVKIVAFTVLEDRQPIMSFGEEINIDSRWFLVRTREGIEGWVFGYFLISVPHNIDDFERLPIKRYLTHVGRTKLRDSPITNDESRILAYLDAGTPVVVVGRTKSKDSQIIRSSNGKAISTHMHWYKVKVSSVNEEGWIFGYFLLRDRDVIPSELNKDRHDDLVEELSTTVELPIDKDPALVAEEDFDNATSIFEVDEEINNSLYYKVGPAFRAREIVYAPSMEYNQSVEGRVVVNVCVNKYGEVIRTRFQRRGSNTNDPHLRSYSIYLAELFEFEPSNVNKTCGEIAFFFSY